MQKRPGFSSGHGRTLSTSQTPSIGEPLKMVSYIWGQRDSGYDAYWQLTELHFSWIHEWGDYVSYVGKPQVSFMLYTFESDDWFGDEGWYVDDVLLKKQVQGQVTTSDRPDERLDWVLMLRTDRGGR